MKSKIKILINFAVSVLVAVLIVLPAAVTAQRGAPPLHPILQGLATAESNARWIDFRPGVALKAETFFKDLKAGFELSSNDEMKVEKVRTGKFGLKHHKYQQYFKNLKVLYAQYIVHETLDGNVKTANGLLVPGLKREDKPTVTESNALTIALRFVGAKKYLWQNEQLEQALKRQRNNSSATYYPKGELLFAPDNYDATFLSNDYRLSWKFDIYTDDRDAVAKSVYVDALTGVVLLHSDIAKICAAGTGTTAFNGDRTLHTRISGSTHQSHNDCQSTDLIVYNCGGSGPVNTYYTDADNTWTNASASQAQWGVEMVYDYYNGYHGRQSWDGAAGDMIVYNNAYVGSNNACWGCTGNSTIYYAGATAAPTDDWNTNDIMGHEFNHGVNQDEVNMPYQKESGAIDESLSDIFGEMVESWSEGINDWLIGGDRGAIRSFSNPNIYNDPDTYNGTNYVATVGCTPSGPNDNCGVHTNSGVQNHWFYLLSNGGTGTNDLGQAYNVTGISRFAARDIVYDAVVNYMTSSVQFIDARQATLRAARDRFGGCSTQEIAVGDAWHAVGVESQSPAHAFNVCGTISTGGYVSPATQAISEVKAANGCANLVTSSTDIRYYAARDRVILYPGFRAQEGSRFVAYIEPCSVTRWTGDDHESRISDAEKGLSTAITQVTKNGIFGESAIEPFITKEKGIGVNPNPFKATFDLSINSGKTDFAQVNIYNSLGSKVQGRQNINLSIGSNKITFDGSRLTKGVYVVEIIIGNEKTIRKVVKM